MTWLPWTVAGALFLVGIAGVATSRNLVHAVVCLSVAQSSTYVLLLSVGFRRGATAPVYADVSTTARTVDPVVQALTLTDVVVGATVTALLLALAIQAHKDTGTLDPDDLSVLEG